MGSVLAFRRYYLENFGRIRGSRQAGPWASMLLSWRRLCVAAASQQAAEQAAHRAEADAGRHGAAGRAAVASSRQVAADFLGEVDDRHALQPDMAGAGEGGEEQAFAAEQDVLEALHHLDVEADGRLEHADMAGMDEQAFAGRQIALDHFAGKIEPDDARAGDLLQDEAVAAKEAGAQALLPGKLKRHRFLRDEERLLATDERLAGLQLRGHQGTGKARGEGDMAGAGGGEIGDEERAAGERALEAGEEAAAGMRVHLDRVVHPGHGVGLAVDRLAGAQIDRHRLHDRAGNFIAHRPRPLVRTAESRRAIMAQPLVQGESLAGPPGARFLGVYCAVPRLSKCLPAMPRSGRGGPGGGASTVKQQGADKRAKNR